MGEKKRRLTLSKQFIRDNPICCYCGAPSETVDEMPPRAMFLGRQWPEGMQFPACIKCNKGRGAIDAIVSLHVKGGEVRDEYLDTEGFKKLWRDIHKRYPDATPKLAESREEQQKVWESAGFPAASRLVLPNLASMISSKKTVDLLQVFLLRLLQAIYYREQSAILPLNHLACVSFRTNATFMKAGSFDDLASTMVQGLPMSRPTKRGNTDLTEQFHYRWGRMPDESVFCYCAKFGTAFVAFAFSAPEEFFYRHSLKPTIKMDGTFIQA